MVPFAFKAHITAHVSATTARWNCGGKPLRGCEVARFPTNMPKTNMEILNFEETIDVSNGKFL